MSRRVRRSSLAWLICRVLTLSLLGGILPAAARAQMPGMPDMGHAMKDMRWSNTLLVLFDELEYVPGTAGRLMAFDGRMWYGGAYRRVWLRGEGDFTTAFADNVGEGEVQLLYGRLVDPFWDAVIGVRLDRSWGGESDGRAHLAIGFLGLAPYRFELEPTVFVSQNGDVSARIDAAFPVLITQKLIAEPSMEIDAAVQRVPRFGVRSGLNDYEAGLRIRYEFRREFAPYVGWSWTRRFGEVPSGGVTNDARTGSVSGSRLVVGLRIWR